MRSLGKGSDGFCIDLAWFVLVWLDLARFGSSWLVLACSDLPLVALTCHHDIIMVYEMVISSLCHHVVVIISWSRHGNIIMTSWWCCNDMIMTWSWHIHHYNFIIPYTWHQYSIIIITIIMLIARWCMIMRDGVQHRGDHHRWHPLPPPLFRCISISLTKRRPINGFWVQTQPDVSMRIKRKLIMDAIAKVALPDIRFEIVGRVGRVSDCWPA